MNTGVILRESTDDDLPIFYEQQQDATANFMAAFTAKDSADRDLRATLGYRVQQPPK